MVDVWKFEWWAMPTLQAGGKNCNLSLAQKPENKGHKYGDK
jgi:hypothetical protein